MASTTFTDGVTLVVSSWLQDVNSVTYTLFGDGSSYTGRLIIADTTDSSSSTTGSMKTAGGLGVAKALNVGTTLTTGGAITVGNLLDLSGASAGQIKFPASQNASANANTLDDYEEGTFTPSAAMNGGSPATITYTQQVGYYTKVGRQVDNQIMIIINAVSVAGSGNSVVTGLPFSMEAVSYSGNGSIGYNDALVNTCSGTVMGLGGTVVYFRNGTRGSGNDTGGWSAGGYLGLTISYFTS